MSHRFPEMMEMGLGLTGNPAAAIGMAGDVLCAILPIFIIWRLSRSVVEKVLVSILLGLGMVAASGGVLKLVILKSWDPFSPTASRDIMEAFIWYGMPIPMTSPLRS